MYRTYPNITGTRVHTIMSTTFIIIIKRIYFIKEPHIFCHHSSHQHCMYVSCMKKSSLFHFFFRVNKFNRPEKENSFFISTILPLNTHIYSTLPNYAQNWLRRSHIWRIFSFFQSFIISGPSEERCRNECVRVYEANNVWNFNL